MKKILVLHTGGTIAMSEDEHGAVAPGAENPLNKFSEAFTDQLDLVVENPFNPTWVLKKCLALLKELTTRLTTTSLG